MRHLRLLIIGICIYLPINLLGKIINILIREMNIRKKRDFDIYEKYIDLEINNSLKHFHQYFKESIFIDNEKIRKFSINEAIKEYKNKELFLEFGVRAGTSIKLFSKILNNYNIPIYGFDSFFGINENWFGTNRKKGEMSRDGKFPDFIKPKNIIYEKGLVQDTLLNFLKNNNSLIRFIHMDLDTYQSSKFVLENVKHKLARNSFILFDQFYNCPGWENGEYKAFTEVFLKKEYDYIAFSKKGGRVLIRINK